MSEKPGQTIRYTAVVWILCRHHHHQGDRAITLVTQFTDIIAAHNMLPANGSADGTRAVMGFLPEELFSGSHKLLENAYSPMKGRCLYAVKHIIAYMDFSQ